MTSPPRSPLEDLVLRSGEVLAIAHHIPGRIRLKLVDEAAAAAVLGGAAFLGACDLLARVLPTRVEAPLGVVTGLIGAPLFLMLLIRMRREAPA